MPKPSGTYLKPYEGKEVVLTEWGRNGEERQVRTGKDAKQLLEPGIGQHGEEIGPEMVPFQADWAFPRLYSAWKALVEREDNPIPDWEEYLQNLPDDEHAVDTLAGENPQFLTLEPTLVASVDRPRCQYRSDISAWSDIAGSISMIEEYARREEFLPDDPSVREDYRVLMNAFRSAAREVDKLMRMDVWLAQMERDPAILNLLRTGNTRGMSPEAVAFRNAYRDYCRRSGEMDSDTWGMLSRERIDQTSQYWSYAGIMPGYLLGYIWGDQPRNPMTGLKGFSTDYTAGADAWGPCCFYYSLIREGIDPDSVMPFLENLRNVNIRQRMDNREYDEAILHLASWRKDDAQDIARFAQGLEEALGSGNLPADEEDRVLLERLEDADALSENARQTLAANFDRTFSKYFSKEQMETGSVFSYIRVNGKRMGDILQRYDGDEPDTAMRDAKVELMARILAGGAVELEKVLPDGTVKRRPDGTSDWAPLRVETGQPAFERIVGRISRVNFERGYISGLPMDQRRDNLRQAFRNIYAGAGVPELMRDGAEDAVRNRMRQNAQETLAAEGISDAAVHSVLEAGKTARLHRMIRELSAYRSSLPEPQARDYDRYLNLLQNCSESLDQLRSDQEFVRAYPQLQNTRALCGNTQKWQLSGRELDDMIENEAERLYRMGMSLAGILRSGIGIDGPADGTEGLDQSALQELNTYLETEGESLQRVRGLTDSIRQGIPARGNRFAGAAAISVDLGAIDAGTVSVLTRPEPDRSISRLSPEMRQTAVQSFDPVFGAIFGNAQREQLAARGMDIYDCIFVEGRSLSDLYRQTPERRPYEKMESDMKCHFLEHVLNGERIDVMVADAAGQEKLVRLMPYDSTGVLARNTGARAFGGAAGPAGEARIQSAVAESRQRLAGLLGRRDVLLNRKEHIRYAHGTGNADGNDVFYRAAAQRFDRNRPDMTSAYLPANFPAAGMIHLWSVSRYPYGSGITNGTSISNEEAARMVSSLAQMYLLSQRPDIHLADLADPESFREEKREIGAKVAEALRKGMGGDWAEYDEIIACTAHMMRPMKLREGQELPEALREVRPRDMRRELAAVMGLDPDRRPPYSQAEFLRLMDSPENSPRVSAVLSLAGQLAQDVREMSRGRTTAAAAARNLMSAAAAEWRQEFDASLETLAMIGRAEDEWLNAAQNYRDPALNGREIERAADVRLGLEDVRRIIAGNGFLPENDGAIRRLLNYEGSESVRPRAARMGLEPSAQLIRDLAERPFADLGLTDYKSPFVSVSIPQQYDTGELRTLAGLADRNRSADPAEHGALINYAAQVFDQMFTTGAEPIFDMHRQIKMMNEGIDPMDRIYIEGRSMNDLCREQYGDLLETNRNQALGRMKADFMIRMLQGARIDVAVEKNGVETISAVALQTDIRELNRRAWLRLPQGAEELLQYADSSYMEERFKVPPMTAEVAERIYASQWAASERAIRLAGAAAGPAQQAQIQAGSGTGPAQQAQAQTDPGTAEARRTQADPETEAALRTQERERLRRQSERMEAGRTGAVADSERRKFNLDLKDHDDIRRQLFRLYSDGEGQLKDILVTGPLNRDAAPLKDAAVELADKMILGATYASAPDSLKPADRKIPTPLQQRMGYGPDNMTEMFFIDGMSVDEYARKHGMKDAVAEDRAYRENNRKAILAAAFLSGEHHVDMIRVGLEKAQDYDKEGNAVRRTGGSVYDENYKTGVLELQAELAVFDGMERFYQKRPSRKAEQFYSDDSGRRDRHAKIRQIADEKLYAAMTRIRQAEEEGNRTRLAEAAERDRTSRWEEQHPAPASPSRRLATELQQEIRRGSEPKKTERKPPANKNASVEKESAEGKEFAEKPAPGVPKA